MDSEKYKMGWLIVFFDLPTSTPEDKKNYTTFRKQLQEDGYSMIQYSVYARACVTYDRVQTHTRRIKDFLPPEGTVRCMFVTNTQWDKTFVYYGGSKMQISPPESLPEQLLLW